MPKRITFSLKSKPSTLYGQVKDGLSKQSLKDLKVSTSAMTRVEKDIIVLKSVKFGVFQFLNYHLYIKMIG